MRRRYLVQPGTRVPVFVLGWWAAGMLWAIFGMHLLEDDLPVLGAIVYIPLAGALAGLLLFLAVFAIWGACRQSCPTPALEVAAWLEDKPTDEERLRSRLQHLQRRNDELELKLRAARRDAAT